MRHSDSKAIAETLPHSVQRGMFHVLRASYKKDFPLKILVYLGMSDREHLYSTGLPARWFGQLLLQDSHSSDSSVLTGTELEGKCGIDCGILLPSNPGIESSGRVIPRHRNTVKYQHWFGMQVGQGADRHIEGFERRRPYSSEAQSVGESREPNNGNPTDRPDQGNEIANSSHEAVAVSAGSGDWKSMHKTGTF
ncbi:hypothetical protein H9Q74_011332 [Fusarium xylarioides]|nr:hypothetical protein H9Q71_011301 [Fusarium xylarioides]KAG5816034.1 hypothetical protein H9Q74_011332 [Fusarium xylarioides]